MVDKISLKFVDRIDVVVGKSVYVFSNYSALLQMAGDKNPKFALEAEIVAEAIVNFDQLCSIGDLA